MAVISASCVGGFFATPAAAQDATPSGPMGSAVAEWREVPIGFFYNGWFEKITALGTCHSEGQFNIEQGNVLDYVCEDVPLDDGLTERGQWALTVLQYPQ
jgi:hypothetical protein